MELCYEGIQYIQGFIQTAPSLRDPHRGRIPPSLGTTVLRQIMHHVALDIACAAFFVVKAHFMHPYGCLGLCTRLVFMYVDSHVKLKWFCLVVYACTEFLCLNIDVGPGQTSRRTCVSFSVQTEYFRNSFFENVF